MSSYHNQAIAYRLEIDGLRAIAVVPVILFHAGFELFSGGFVGVDVFFVISGYLITSIILREMEQGKFSIVRFYERRARRILPALFFVIACCLPFAWMWMLPDELKRFGQSLVAVATFLSNIYFWRNTDYFAPTAEEQPLLHTWSLAVEEQYYVLFPLFLMLCWRFGKSKVFWLTIMSAALSLLLAEWAWRNQPVANFYLLPTRAWELLAGSLIAFLPKDLAEKAKTYRSAQVFSAAGLLMILYSILFFDGQTPFPSTYTIVPVLGSVLLIICTNRQGVIGNVLASKPVVGIGLISYSAYLWHQPIFAFIRLRSFDHPSQLEFALGAIASLALAYFSWRFVEQPTRKIKLSQASLMKFSILGLVGTMAVGLTNHIGDGFKSRFQDLAAWKFLRETPQEQMKKYYGRGTCFIDYHQNVDVLVKNNCLDLTNRESNKASKIILAGDSMAAHYWLALSSLASQTSREIHQITGTSCRPYSHERMSRRCVNLRKFLLDALGQVSEDDIVVISANWQIEFSTNKGFEEALSELLTEVAQSKAQVILVGQVPSYDKDPNKVLLRAEIFSSEVQSNLPDERYVGVNKLIKDTIKDFLPRKGSITFINPASVLCQDGACFQHIEGEALYIDKGHLTPFGASLVVGQMRFLEQ